jgi:hypothetical protein
MGTMRDDLRLPDLTFPTVTFGSNEVPWDLTSLLFAGGAATNTKVVQSMIEAGQLGPPLPERIMLVQAIHEAINGTLAGGGARASAKGSIAYIRGFFAWADQAGQKLSVETVQTAFVQWTDHLLHRARVIKDVPEWHSYSNATTVGCVLDKALERQSPLLELTRISVPQRRRSAIGIQAEKQNLQQTFEFGHLLQDICDGLPLDVVWGPLPVRISLRNESELVRWSRMTPRRAPNRNRQSDIRWVIKVTKALRDAYENDKTLRTRYPLVNLRVEAELLMFIAQTGMNPAQANKIKMADFFFSSHEDGYKVRERKNRRGGDVLFVIFREYRSHFERYLDWRRSIFGSDDELLFPFARRTRANHNDSTFYNVRRICKEQGILWVPPMALRRTRVNWILRRSGDPSLTAEMHQHAVQTLHKRYENPSLQRAIGEVMRFWSNADPSIVQTVPVVPGVCDGNPAPVPLMPKDVTKPDCIHPSGCIWCAHHRDVDSQDYVWSLACFRHLKVVEVGKYHAPATSRDVHPGELVIARLSDKLRWFRESNDLRKSWVDKSLEWIEEGRYHPDWSRLIEGMEGQIA